MMASIPTDNYGIKPGYRANATPTTMDYVSGQNYWTPERIASSFYYQFQVYDYAIALAKKLKTKTLIDVGCGVAPKLAYMKKCIPSLDIVGVDQPDPIDYCKRTYDFGMWLTDDFENPSKDQLPFNPGIIISSDVIEHLDNPDNLLSYIRKIAGPDTHVILSTPERDMVRGVECSDCPHGQHIREWNKQEFATYLKSRGFLILEHFLVPSFKMNLRSNFVKFKIKQLFSGRPTRNNQVVLLKVGQAT